MLAHHIMTIPTTRLFHPFFKILNYVHRYDKLSGEIEVNIFFSQQENLSVASIWLWYSPLILLLTLRLYLSVTTNNHRLHAEEWNDYNRILWGQQSAPFAQCPSLGKLSWCGIHPASCSLTIMQIRPWQTEFIWGHCKPFLTHRVLGKAREGSYYRQVSLKQ